MVSAESIKSDDAKLTAWVQWTITRCTIELLSHDSDDFKGRGEPNLKIVVDAEDIVSSVDFQSVFLKVKSKVAGATIQHYKR